MTTPPDPPERRRNLNGELASIAEAMGRLAAAVETNMSEDRLQAILAEEQRTSRKRLVALLVVALLVSLAGLAQSRANHDQNRSVGRVVRYIDGCLTHAVTLDEAERARVCGPQTDGTATAVKVLFCVELTGRERPLLPADLDGCSARVQSGDFG